MFFFCFLFGIWLVQNGKPFRSQRSNVRMSFPKGNDIIDKYERAQKKCFPDIRYLSIIYTVFFRVYYFILLSFPKDLWLMHFTRFPNKHNLLTKEIVISTKFYSTELTKEHDLLVSLTRKNVLPKKCLFARKYRSTDLTEEYCSFALYIFWDSSNRFFHRAHLS